MYKKPPVRLHLVNISFGIPGIIFIGIISDFLSDTAAVSFYGIKLLVVYITIWFLSNYLLLRKIDSNLKWKYMGLGFIVAVLSSALFFFSLFFISLFSFIPV